MKLPTDDRTRQLFLRELVFVAVSLVLVTAPALFALGPLAWMALGGLIAVAAGHPRALVFTVPAVIPLSFHPFRLGDLQFNPLEILVVAMAVGYAPRIAIAAWRLRGVDREHVNSVIRTAMPDRIAALAAFILLIAGGVAILSMADPGHAAESLRTARWTIIAPVIYFFVAAPVIQQSDLSRSLATMLFLAGAVIASGIAIIDGVSGGGIQADSVTRLSGLAPHPNALALVLDRAAVLGLLTAILFRERIPAQWMAPSVFVTLTVALTFSRGAILGIIAGCLLILMLASARRLAVVFAVASAAILALLVLVAPARTLTFLGGGSGSLRLELWNSSVRMIRDHPVTGVGPDQFLYQYLPRYVSPEAWPERFTSHPHNLILDAWLSLGIIGLVVLGVIGALVIQRVREAITTQDRITLASAGALITALTHGMVDHGYFLPELAMSIWFLVILLRPAPDSQVTEKRSASVSESKG